MKHPHYGGDGRKRPKRVELTLNLQNYPILPFLFDKIAIFALKSDSYWKNGKEYVDQCP